jgi:hypothetical protein
VSDVAQIPPDAQRTKAIVHKGRVYVRALDVIDWLRKQEESFATLGPAEVRAARALRETFEEAWPDA